MLHCNLKDLSGSQISPTFAQKNPTKLGRSWCKRKRARDRRLSCHNLPLVMQWQRRRIVAITISPWRVVVGRSVHPYLLISVCVQFCAIYVSMSMHTLKYTYICPHISITSNLSRPAEYYGIVNLQRAVRWLAGY